MAALVNAIKFRYLFDQLTEEECDRFMSKLSKLHGTKFIASLLFNSWSSNPQTMISDNKMTDIIEIIADIIESRDNPQTNEDTNIDTIIHYLIGEIASYLNGRDHSRFARSNRTTYIECNSPNSLREINLCEHSYNYKYNKKLDDYLLIDFSKYSSLKTLQIAMKDFDKFRLPKEGNFILNNLTNISLDHQCNLGVPPVDIIPFMTQKCIKFDKIEIFSLMNIKLKYEADAFWTLLRKFKNIKHLQLSGIRIDEYIPDNEIKILFPNLTQLSCSANLILFPKLSLDLIWTFVHFYGHNLKHLCLECCPESQLDLFLDDVDFKNLHELILCEPTEQTMCNILKSAEMLKKCKIIFPNNSTDPQIQKNIICNLISSSKALECIQFDKYYNDLVNVVNGIEAGLVNTRHIKRKYLKIGILYKTRPKTAKIDDIILCISRIKDILETSQIDDYILFFQLEGNFDADFDIKEVKKAIYGFQWFEPETIVQCYEKGRKCYDKKICIVVMNKGCKINEGYLNSFHE